jgi:hypothetical protein
MTFSSSLSNCNVCRFAAVRNRTIDSRLSEHELALPGSDYPSLASNAWGRKYRHHAVANNGRGTNELKSIGDSGGSLGEW